MQDLVLSAVSDIPWESWNIFPKYKMEVLIQSLTNRIPKCLDKQYKKALFSLYPSQRCVSYQWFVFMCVLVSVCTC